MIKTVKFSWIVLLFAVFFTGALFAEETDSLAGLPGLVFKYQVDGICREPVALGGDGAIYMAVRTYGDSIPEDMLPMPRMGALEALNPDGSLKWRHYTERIQLCPVVGPDETIYVRGYGSDTLFALDPQGNIRWFRYLRIDSAPATGPDSLLYFSWAGDLYALDSEGTLSIKNAYSADYQLDIDGSPSVWKDGVIYLGEEYFYSMLPDGSIRYSGYRGITKEVCGRPAICPDGTAVFPLHNGEIYAVDSLGEFKWSFQVTERWPYGDYKLAETPVVAPDGTIYAGNHTSRLYAINPDGTLKWMFEIQLQLMNERIARTPVIGADGTIYFGTGIFHWCDVPPCPKYPPPMESYFYALAPQGNVKWRYPLDYGVSAPAALSGEGILYFPTDGGRLYALDTGTGKGQAKTGWPGTNFDAQNTGNGSEVYARISAGDFNGNGEAEIGDAVAMILFSRNFPDHSALDINGDGRYNIVDVIQLILNMRK
ncbi:PQQ-binding-like beta-propeller repeat protein [Gemmatimonadota bacterium]